MATISSMDTEGCMFDDDIADITGDDNLREPAQRLSPLLRLWILRCCNSLKARSGNTALRWRTRTV